MRETRRYWLKELLNGPRFNSDRGAFCRDAGISNGRLSQLLDTKEPFGDVAAKKLIEKLDLQDDFFTRPIPSLGGQKLAEEESNVSEVKRRAKVPLISMVQAGELSDVLDLFHPGEAAHWVEPIYTNPSASAYALRVEGDSMESPIPGSLTFLEGTILIVDPNAATAPGDYVIAKDVVTQKATFKKLTTDGVRFFLKPLNPAYLTVEIDDPALRIIGKVIEHQPPGGKL
jgi:SOS-response transcriptional repressor LexA